jgi:hypothetical protein
MQKNKNKKLSRKDFNLMVNCLIRDVKKPLVSFKSLENKETVRIKQ